MDKLFTPLGEDWEKVWLPYGWREEIDWGDGFNSRIAIKTDLERAALVGEYFHRIRETFKSKGYNRFRPYISDGVRCKSFSDLLNNVRQLYKAEVGEPSEELSRFLSRQRINVCLKYIEGKHLLDAISYPDDTSGMVVISLEGEPEEEDIYKYPIYRVDGTLKVIDWIKSLLQQGVSIGSIEYCHYHGDSYPGQYLVEWERLEESRRQSYLYREELLNNAAVLGKLNYVRPIGYLARQRIQ